MKGSFTSLESTPEVKPIDLPKSTDGKIEIPSDKMLFDTLKDIFNKKDGQEPPPEVSNMEGNPLENKDSGRITLPDGTVIELPKPIENALQEVRLPGSNGSWDGEKGDSTWHPNPEYTPPEKSKNPDKPYSNPDQLSWGEIMEKYGIDGIDYKDGYPVFDDVARGTVEINDFTDDRTSNFSQANGKMAEQKGCTPEEVEQWMKDNNYTWHECQDCKTMQKVPNEVHANIPHEGGVSVYKSEHNN